MTKHSSVGVWLGLGCVATLLAAASPALAADLRWHVRLYANSPDQIEVLVDTKASPDNLIVDRAEFEGQFFDASGKPVGTRTFGLLDERIRALTAGHVYALRFVHGYSGARKVSSNQLRYYERGSGGKWDGSTQQVAPSEVSGKPDVTVEAAKQPMTVVHQAIVPTWTVAVKTLDPTIRRCRIYSDIAVAQNEANIGNRCSRTGPMWNSKYSYHFDWCIYAPAQHTRDGTAARQRELDQCAP